MPRCSIDNQHGRIQFEVTREEVLLALAHFSCCNFPFCKFCGNSFVVETRFEDDVMTLDVNGSH